MLLIVSLTLAAVLTSFLLTGANIAIQRKDNRADETCECGKSIILSCVFKKNTFAIVWRDANDIKPIAKCIKQFCSLNPDYVEQYSISFDMAEGHFDLTVLKVTMELNGKMLVCSDGSNADSYNMSVRDYEPYLTDDSNTRSIKAASGCISQDTQVSFKWIKVNANSNVETEINPKIIAKSNTSCTNDSDCGNGMQVYYSEIIAATASFEGNYYLKVTAMYGNDSRESFSSEYSGQKYIIVEQDEEQLNSSVIISIAVATLIIFAIISIVTVIVLRKGKYFRSRRRSSEKEDKGVNETSSSKCQFENGAKVNAEKPGLPQHKINENDEKMKFLSDQSTEGVDIDLNFGTQCDERINKARGSSTFGLKPKSQSRICKYPKVQLNENKPMVSSMQDESHREHILPDPNYFTTAQTLKPSKMENNPAKE